MKLGEFVMITILRTYLLIMDLLIVRGYEFKSLFQLIYIYIYIFFKRLLLGERHFINIKMSVIFTFFFFFF